jgi:hypothetical protein
MMNFEKSDLKYSYKWDENTNVDYTKKIRFYDTYSLDTDNGYAVLQFINSYMNLKNYSMISTFHKIEKAIKEDLPNGKNGHNKVKRWLNENYFF